MANILASDLRAAVLQAAIEGRLTEQNNEDTSAYSLISSIQEERSSLAAQKKIKKLKTYSSNALDELNIPDNWAKAHLGEISTYQESHRKVKYTEAQGDMWTLDLEDIEKGGRVRSKVYVRDRVSSGDKTVFVKGDILYSKLRPYLLKILVADEDGICTSELVPFKMYGNIDSEYIVSFLKSPYVDNYINSVTYGVKMPRVNTETMENLMVPIPPIEEQHRIVARIEELMAKIDEYEKLENQLAELKEKFPEEMKATILQAAMEGKLTTQSETDSSVNKGLAATKKHGKLENEVNVPETWVVAHLEDVTNPIPTKPYQVLESEIMEEGLFPVISQSKNYSIGFSNLEEKVINCEKPLVIFGDHTTIVKIADFPFIVGADGVKIFEATEDIDPEYLFYVMTNNVKLIAGKGGYSRHYKYLKNLSVPIPSLEEQRRIVEKLGSLLPLCDELVEMV